MADAVAAVQQQLNEAAGLRLLAQRVPVDEDRIDGILNKVCTAEHYEDVAYMLDEPVRTFSRMAVDDTLKANVQFQGRAGLHPRVVRRTTGSCCEWCSRLAGSYDYPHVPADVYRRHERCRCKVEYDPGDGRRQNVWDKKWTEDPETLQARKEFAESPLVTKIRFPKEASLQNVLPEYLRTAAPGVGSISYDAGYGIKSMASSVTQAMQQGISGAINWIKSLPGQAVQWGKNLIQSFISGLNGTGTAATIATAGIQVAKTAAQPDTDWTLSDDVVDKAEVNAFRMQNLAKQVEDTIPAYNVYRNVQGAQLELHESTSLQALCRPDRYLWLAGSEHLMRICSAQTADHRLVVSARDAAYILDDRSSLQTLKNFSAETTLRQLVTAMEPWPGVELGDLAEITDTYTGEAAPGSLLDVAEQVCQELDIGFRLRFDPAEKKLLFELYRPLLDRNARYTAPDGSKYLLQVSAAGETVFVPVVPKKALFIGNSLLVGFGQFGMCASNAQSDYYYHVTQAILKQNASFTADRSAGTSLEGATSDEAQDTAYSNISGKLSADLDLVIVQLSDNTNNAESIAYFLGGGAKRLLTKIRTACPKARVVWAAAWYSSTEKLNAIQKACADTGCLFVDFSDLRTSENQGAIGNTITYPNGETSTVEASGVASHPGDTGMKAIADRLLEKLGIANDGAAAQQTGG